VDISHRPRRRKSGAVAVVSSGTWPETVLKSITTVVVDTNVVPEEDTVGDTEEVTEVVLKAEAFVSTSCQR